MRAPLPPVLLSERSASFCKRGPCAPSPGPSPRWSSAPAGGISRPARGTRTSSHVADVGVERTMHTGDVCSVVRILWVLLRGHRVRCPAPAAAPGCLLEMAWFRTPRRSYPGPAFLQVPLLPFLAESVASGRVPAIFHVLCLAPATWEVTCTPR